MAKVRSENTGPELRVRKFLHARGLRYRLHAKSLPGKPDLVLKGSRTVVFVHGCFWHQHPDCRRARMPMSNRAYWTTKLGRNVQRDRDDLERLRTLGWNVITVWECELSDERLDLLVTEIKTLAHQASWR